MSIEKDLQDLTAAIRELIAALPAGAVQAAAPADVKVPAAAAAKAPVAEPQALTFDVLKARFLALVKTNRPKAEGILKALGLTKLTDAKLPQYPEVDKALTAEGV